MKSFSKQIAFTALFAALCAVATYAVAIPFPSGMGYFNLGDVLVLLSGWLLGPLFGAIAAGVGSALADLLSGYAVYAPATLLIKGMVAFLGYVCYALCRRLAAGKTALDFLPRLLAAFCAELVMVGGYLLFEGVILQYGAGAFAGVIGNMLQALCGAIGGTAVVAALYPIGAVRRYFPYLTAIKRSENVS